MEDSQGGENVKVVVRVRPLNSNETKEGFRMITKVNTIDGTIKVEIPKRDPSNMDTPAKIFTFDTVFAPDVKQVDVYNRVARPIVSNVLEGYNGTIFAYGQTGTGKTHTMEGARDDPGVIPRSFAHIFDHIAGADQNQQYLVRASYLEIYQVRTVTVFCSKLQQPYCWQGFFFSICPLTHGQFSSNSGPIFV